MSRRPSQIYAVAKRRYGDACSLRDTGHKERAPGAIYLAGLAVEIALKGRMLAAFPWLATARSSYDSLRGERRRICGLYWKLHDLDGLAHATPGVISLIRHQGGIELVEQFKRICSEWSIEIRYDTKPKTAAEAIQFVAVAQTITRCLCA